MRSCWVLAVVSISVPTVVAAQPLNTLSPYSVPSGTAEIRAPFCSGEGLTTVSVWAVNQGRGGSGRGGGYRVTAAQRTTLTRGTLVDVSGAPRATLAVRGNYGTMSAKLAGGCYTVLIDAVGSGNLGGLIQVQVTGAAPPVPPAAPAARGDDS